MKPGRELDVLVAEKIFGAKIIERFKQSGGHESFKIDRNLNEFLHPAIQDRMDSSDFFDKADIAKGILKGANFSIFPEYQTAKDIKLGVVRARLAIHSGDRKGALELLGKHLGLFDSSGQDHNKELKAAVDEAIQKLNEGEIPK